MEDYISIKIVYLLFLKIIAPPPRAPPLVSCGWIPRIYMDKSQVSTFFNTRKRFSEKPIVAFTNSTVLNFILDFYMYD